MAKPEDNPPPPLCVFCNAPWTDDMVKIYAEAQFSPGTYEACFDGVAVQVDVTCSTCNRLVYRKSVNDADRL